MDAEQELREFQREYLDFLDDEVCSSLSIMLSASSLVPKAAKVGNLLLLLPLPLVRMCRRSRGCTRRRCGR